MGRSQPRARTSEARRERDRVREGNWTAERALEELRRRAAAGRSLVAHRNGVLRIAVRALFGSWRAGLTAAGLAPRGEPGRARTAIRDPLDVLFPCRACGARFTDMGTHIVTAHRLSPRRYELAYGPLPDTKAAQRAVLEALRGYIASGARPTASELRRRAPRLYRAVRLIGLFESVEAALAYVVG